MSKNIWIVNHYAFPPYLPGGTRHFDLGKKLVDKGYNVTILASSFHYHKLQDFKEYQPNQVYLKENIDGVNFVWLKTSIYSKNNWRRFVNMISFNKSFNAYLKKETFKKPHTIIGSSIHMFAVYAAYKASLKYKSRFYMEVRDLWPQTLIDMGMSRLHPVVLLFGFLEKYLYKKAEKIITLLPKSISYIEQKGVHRSKIYWLPNGVDLSRFEKPSEPRTNNIFTVVYTGIIGVINRLDLAIEAAEILKERQINDVFFRIVGDGQERERLIKIVEENKLTNIEFVGSVPKENVHQELANADVLFFALADSPVYKYGLSANKLFDYLASRKPIIFSCKAGNDPVKESGAGISIPPDNPEKVVEAILKIKDTSKEDLTIMGEKGYNYVKQIHGMESLSNKLESIILEKL